MLVKWLAVGQLPLQKLRLEVLFVRLDRGRVAQLPPQKSLGGGAVTWRVGGSNDVAAGWLWLVGGTSRGRQRTTVDLSPGRISKYTLQRLRQQ
jgi:hypothetical protein